jgi:hypothetical protein
LDHLDFQSFWLDEVLTAKAASLDSIQEVLGWASIWVDNTPLLLVVTWLLGPLGGSELAVRLPLALAGALTVPAVYALGRTVASPSVGLAAAIMLAVGPYAVHYSQEARVYALVMLVTTVQMLFAYRVVVRAGRWDWVGMAVFTVLALHTSHFGLATTGAAFVWIASTLWLDGAVGPFRRRRIPSNDEPPGRPRATSAALVLVVALVAYVPIVPLLVEFLGRADLGFDRFGAVDPLSLDQNLALLGALDLRGPALVLTAVGLLVALYRSVRLGDRGALLVLTWVGLPLIGMFVLSSGRLVGIWPRYFAFLYPATAILAAMALVAMARVLADLGTRALRRLQRNAGPALDPLPSLLAASITACFLMIVVGDRYPAVVRGYETLKGEDNRGAVAAIIAASPPESSVIALGRNRAWLMETIAYYLWQQRSEIDVYDGDRLGDQGLTQVQQGGDLWGIVLADWNQLPAEPPPGGTYLHVHGLNLVHLPADGSWQIDRLDRLAEWAQGFDTELSETRSLIELVADRSSSTGNLLPPPDRNVRDGSADSDSRWVIGPEGGVDAGGTRFVFGPATADTNITFSTDAPVAAGRYAVTFRCRGTSGSEPRVYVTEGSVADLTSSDAARQVYPDGAGYRCPTDGRWTIGAFMFTPSSPSRGITVWLRNTGSDAMFEAIKLQAAPM